MKKNCEKNYENLILKMLLAHYYYKFLIAILKNIWKSIKNHNFLKKFCTFFSYQYKDGYAEEKNLNRNLGAKNTLLDSKRENYLKKTKRKEKATLKINVRNLLRLKKETEPIKDIINLFRLNKENKASNT